MDVLGVTTTLSMWAHFAGGFFFGKWFKMVLPPGLAWVAFMCLATTYEAYQLSFAPHPTIWWDSAIDTVMHGLGAFIAVRWVHE